jgi:hypothetical protein
MGYVLFNGSSLRVLRVNVREELNLEVLQAPYSVED